MSNNKQSSVEWFAEETFNLIELMKRNYVSQEEFLGSMLKLREQAKAMHKQETMDFAAEWSVCQLRSDKIWHLDDLYNEKFTDNI